MIGTENASCIVTIGNRELSVSRQTQLLSLWRHDDDEEKTILMPQLNNVERAQPHQASLALYRSVELGQVLGMLVDGLDAHTDW